MTRKSYVGSPQLMPVFEPGEQTRVEVRWQGHPQDAYSIRGGNESAVAKVLADYERRARCGALAKGRWQIVAGKSAASFMVD